MTHPIRQLMNLCRLREAEAPIVASLSLEETGGADISMKELRDNVRLVLKMWQQSGTGIVNAETGISIKISAVGINKTLRSAEPLLRIHYAIPNIIRSGIFVEAMPPRPDDEVTLQQVLKIEAKVALDGKTYPILAFIKQQQAGNFYYCIAIRIGV